MAGFFGLHNFGKVDQVPGAFYVATQFFHFNSIPLLPLSTYVVLHGSECSVFGFGAFTGKKIRMSLKSVLTAYSRAALIVGVVITCAFAVVTFVDGGSKHDVELLITSAVLAFVSAACAVVIWLTYHFSKASYGRAMQLVDELGFSKAFVAKCLDPNHDIADVNEMLEGEPVRTDDRHYDGRERDRDYDRLGPDLDYDRRDY
jgi:hypothetical protein